MSNKPLTISEEAKVSMPMKTVASLIGMVAIGTWAYFGLIETQNQHHTRLQLMEADLEKNTEFRIKWPRERYDCRSSGNTTLGAKSHRLRALRNR